MNAGVILEVTDLTVGYQGRRVVGPIKLSVENNESIALIGPNGVGKSTILKTLAGLLKPIEGRIRHDHEDVTTLPVHVRAQRGLVLASEQRGNVLRSLTVEENLDVARGTGKREPDLDPMALFPKLADRRKQTAGTLSGGELQMLSLAMALSLAPDCLLIDEPSAGLAPSILELIREGLAELRSAGVAVVIAEQRPDVVRGLCDRVAVVTGGELAFLDKDADLSSGSIAREYFGGGAAHHTADAPKTGTQADDQE